ncbi:hypothetical protein AAFC00_006803 [Neodothiora populina]|uniref:Protein BFR2 n=1 Tax=Neodothiora populina TaxID=2781224 RepID=A0ABR3PBG7_9PEZI
MAPHRVKTLAEQLADLENPGPKDFDPEDEAPSPKSDDDDDDDDVVSEVDENAGREHYAPVGKSKLRKKDIVPLGPRYDGSRIDRAELADEEDDPFSRGFDEDDESEDEEDQIDGVSGEDEDEEDGEDVSDEGVEDDDESPATDLRDEEDDDDDEEEDGADRAEDDRAELRKMMAEEQKNVAATLSQAAKADAEKGRAVKTQRATFDSLLNARVKLQKALIGTNTLTALASTPEETKSTDDEEDNYPADAFHAAETAAFNLWASLNNLRETLQNTRAEKTSKKRTHAQFTEDTPTSDLWTHMLSQNRQTSSHTTPILEKWSLKSRGAAAITPRNRLNNSAASEQTIVDVLNEQLAGDRLVKRARTPRSCAPVQLSLNQSESPSVYDDADFYGLLLQSLLEQRSADSVAAAAAVGTSNIDASFQMRRDAKTKKNVDTKASKGRKLRFTVHEKLQNFMAPEDRSVWSDRQSDELFGSLFGQRMGLGEEDDEEEEEDEKMDEDGVDAEEAGLMLFRN